MYRSKAFVVDIVVDSFRQKYRRIHDYGHELLRANPGSIVKITKQQFQDGDESNEHLEMSLNPYFQRMYICSKACKDRFFKCIPIINWMGVS